MLKFCRRIRYSSRSSGPSKASRKTSSASGGMYRSVGSLNSGSPYSRASATWSTTSGEQRRRGRLRPNAGGVARRQAQGLSRSWSGRRRAAAARAPPPVGLRLAVERPVPQQRAAGALFGFQAGLLRLQFVDERSTLRTCRACGQEGHGVTGCCSRMPDFSRAACSAATRLAHDRDRAEVPDAAGAALALWLRAVATRTRPAHRAARAVLRHRRAPPGRGRPGAARAQGRPPLGADAEGRWRRRVATPGTRSGAERAGRREPAGRPGAARRHASRRSAASGPGATASCTVIYGTEVMRTQASAARARLLGGTGFRPGRVDGGRAPLAAVRAGIRAEGRRRLRAGRRGAALGRTPRPDAGHAHQGRARRPAGARACASANRSSRSRWRCRGGGRRRGAARDGRQLPAAGAGQCQRTGARDRHAARAPAPAARRSAPAAHACCASWAPASPESRPSGRRRWRRYSAGSAPRATATRWRRRCCRHCTQAGASGLQLPQIDPGAGGADRAAREPPPRGCGWQLAAFAAGPGATGQQAASAGAPTPGRGCSSRCGATPRVSTPWTTTRATGCASASSGCAT